MLFYLFLVFVFLLGTVVGSGLNVCAYRLPYEKSILWPGSRCGRCYQAIRWYDNIPLVSYCLLRGRCRTCGARFSARYFVVELFTGLAFLGLYYLEIAKNVFNWTALDSFYLMLGNVPFEGWCLFSYHAILLSFLIAASLCDLDYMEIPLGLTVTGTVIGLAGSMLFPWPWPNRLYPTFPGKAFFLPPLPCGIYPWPVWYPLPSWLPAGSWRLGLATGLAGALAGMLVLRGVRFLFGFGRGIEGLGLGDADLMMMAGSFVGWQVILASLFIGTFLGLFVGIFQVLRAKGQAMPFGPSLSAGVLITLLAWAHIGEHYRTAFFDRAMLIMFGVFCPVGLLVISFVLRFVRGTPEEPLPTGEQVRGAPAEPLPGGDQPRGSSTEQLPGGDQVSGTPAEPLPGHEQDALPQP